MHKVIIIGGGPIGLACAALLAQRDIGTVVIDARPLEQARHDARLLALSRGTWAILTPILGSTLPPRAPIREVIVSSAGDFGATRITATDFDGADLGATVRYGELLVALAEATAEMRSVEMLRPIAARDVRQRSDRVEVELADGRMLTADLAVHAEGMPSKQDDEVKVGAWALLADVRLRPMRENTAATAYERFTRDGPLALLPTVQAIGGGDGHSLSLVWCMNESQARRREKLGDTALISELQSYLGARIGTVTAVGPRRSAPLPQRVREQVHAHRLVALGNAAQTLHPVAGQGFNLGVRDCATLADELVAGADATSALARYAARRRTDRAAIALLTDSLPAIFASRFTPLAIARGLGLALLDATPALRREFAHLLMFGVRV